ncbi:MAG: IgA Peptidase M64 [Gammaproteobacteria bacterium]|nr:IgA Peptidase M64 [Gammaproteobacteria bacterium]NNF50634.1 peptidase M64 [Woeseiaceae bacterium]MBT8095109.1 IgA Peptidase M64 [Gammaproteobacteria bacterium]MBT8105676.1 IgA Peptidase M64 [Gammaproteobacteria bacterium]NNK25690.1 peptidase M64 [Woeseiaceae bacterium]
MRAALLVLSLFAFSAACADAPATMRVDYFHSGNHDTEMFSLDQVVVEPLPWTGNMAQPHDKTNRGKYLFEIVDPASGDVAWSRSFSSIYGEWETTGESREINRSFHESVRFPAQDAIFELVIRKRDARNDFEEVWRIKLDPADVLVHRESAMYADNVVAIHKGGDPATSVDLLLMGDGYTAQEHEAFVAKARELAAVLFATSPFKERKNDFNVWALAPPARQSGVSRPSTGTFRDSPIGATYDAFRSERYILTFDNKSMRRIASSAPYDFIEILTNTEVYGGGGIYGLFSTAAANSEWAPYLFVHEFGHHFAGLADEYYTSSVAYEAPDVIIEPYEPNVSALLDPDNLKWKHHVLPNTPLPTQWPKAEFEKHSLAYQKIRREMREADVPEADMNRLFEDNQVFVETLFDRSGQKGVVGAFEGGNYQAEGYFRPEQNCLMFTRTTDFCVVCKEAIEKVIDEYSLSQ